MSLTLRGHQEVVGNDSCYGGNFLTLVAMQARFDSILQDLLSTPSRTTKYLSPQIQNELILLISNRVRQPLISKIQNCAFYSIIVDTTSNITKHDQVSIVLRWVLIEKDKITIEETFLGFLHAMISTAQGLA